MISRAERCPAAVFPPRHFAAGFTLIEVTVVLVVLGLLVGIVVARGPAHSTALDARGTASAIAETLRGARARAIAANRDIAFHLDPGRHGFVADGAPLRVVPPDVQVVVSGAPGRIVFAADGSSSGGLVAVAGGGRRILVKVDWLTGRVSITDAG